MADRCAFMSFGKYHAIEVEADAIAYLKYPSVSKGVFITSTGEAPGRKPLKTDGDLLARHFDRLIAASRYPKKQISAANDDFAASFNK